MPKRTLNDADLIFDASAETIDFSGVPRFDPARVSAVIHGPTGAMIFCPAAGKLGTWSGKVLTVTTTDTTAMSDTDLLIPIYEDPMAEGNSPVLFHDNFDTLDTAKWTLNEAAGDIVLAEGNIASSGYLHMSLSPFAENTETTLTSVDLYEMPIRIGVGAAINIPVLGQEIQIRVRGEETDTAYTPVAIASYSQTTTTMTVTTSTPHGLQIGDRISLSGIADSRANYSNVVVNAVNSSTVFTFTAGPGGTITSISLSGAAGGLVHLRCAIGCFKEGISQIWENTTAANATMHVRTGNKNSFHSGAFAGNQAVTTSTNGFTYPANGQGAYGSVPSSFYETILTPERIEFLDKATDSASAGFTSRFKKETIIPNPRKKYRLEFAIKNNPSLTRPVAKIISSAKAGSTTSTIVHDGTTTFTTGDFVQLYGRRDIAANFPNMTTPAVIASIVNSTTFTIVDGPSVTATTYGGCVVEVNGSTAINTGVAVAASIQNAVRGADGLLVLTGSATWASATTVGDFVNVYGCRDNATGADVGVDGSYRIRNLATSTMTLESIDGTGSGIVSTIACGGQVLRRNGLRLSMARIAEYSRNFVEQVVATNRADAASGQPVAVVAALPAGSAIIGALTANQSISVAQVGGTTALSATPAGASGASLIVGSASPINGTEYNAVAWAAASGSGATINGADGVAMTFDVSVTAWTAGASTGLDVFLQESPDNGTTWYDIWQCEALTAVSRARIPAIPVNGRRRMRWVNRTGAATTATVTVLCMRTTGNVKRKFQFFDRTASVGSGTAASGTNSTAYHVDYPDNLTVHVQTGTATSPASWKVQMSNDGTNFYDASAEVSCPASSMTKLPITAGVTGRLMRVQCTVTGTAALVTAIHIGGAE